MKAVQIHRYGGPEVLTYEEIERPVPGNGEVLVGVRAIGFNPVDFKTRAGTAIARMLGSNPFPLILGWDISGEVIALGPGVTEYAVGDAVYGMNRFPRPGNAYAEYVTAPVSDIAKKPQNLSHVEAAAVPLVALTAWQAFFDIAQLQPGETVLIHAAAGGVGHVATQLAHWKGARVIGTASARNAEFVRSLGADTVIDYTREAFEEHVHNVDVAIDSLGGDVQDRTYKVMKRGGRLVVLGFPINTELAEASGVKAEGMLVHTDQAELQEITRLLTEGLLKVTVETTFPLQEVARAHELLEKQHTRGKVVLTV